MNKRKFKKLIILFLMVILSNILIFKYCELDDSHISLSYKIVSDKLDTYQLFYGVNSEWSEEKSQTVDYTKPNKEDTIKYTIPKNITKLRIDLGNQSANLKIRDINLSYFGKSISLNDDQILDKNNQSQIGKIEKEVDYLQIETTGTDPSITYTLNQSVILNLLSYKVMINNALKLGLCALIDILMFIILKKSKSVMILVRELNSSRELIWNLSKNDFKTKYAGSYLGITWAFIQPIITILVYWFVFEYGLKSGSPLEGVSFIVWLMTGLIPWFFFQEALINATNCMVEYSYLVKKVVFKISVLPIVKIVSALFIHLVFIGFSFFVCAIHGFYPSQYTLQLVYYSFCTFFLVLAISYTTCAIVVFFKDLGQIINIFMQVGMWMTPIMWKYTMIPENYRWIIKLNPMYYIVEGYRDTFINKIWFFEKYFQTAYFWIITLGLFVLGATIFKKLKPHFADVL